MQGSQMNVIIVPSTNAYNGRVILLFADQRLRLELLTSKIVHCHISLKKYSKIASSRSFQNDKYLTLHNLITKIITWFPISQKILNTSENAWITHHLHNYSKIVNHKWKNFMFSCVMEILTVTKTRQHGCTFKMFSPQKTWLVDRWLLANRWILFQ